VIAHVLETKGSKTWFLAAMRLNTVPDTELRRRLLPKAAVSSTTSNSRYASNHPASCASGTEI